MAERVETVEATAYTIPTDRPESDGTIAWSSTTLVVVELRADGASGLGFTYASAAAALVIEEALAAVVRGSDPRAIPGTWRRMVGAVRNVGRPGIASMAISAVDVALWDLKARLAGQSVATMLGAARDAVAVYGSGGFTSYTIDELRAQLGGWAEAGIRSVKMKVGRDPSADPERVQAARDAIGPRTRLYVDANGGYRATQALALATEFARVGVTWLEEPVPSDDLAGLRFVRDRAPLGMEVAAGEYGHDAEYFRRMLEAGAVDVLQADATRCGGVTGFLHAAALCEAFGLPLSAHTAPSIHAHLCCAAPPAREVEYFHDHARIEHMLFDGAATPRDGDVRPDPARPGWGLAFDRAAARRYRVHGRA